MTTIRQDAAADQDLPDDSPSPTSIHYSEKVTVSGGPGDDTLFGTDADDLLIDTGGNAIIDGRGGNDVIRLVRSDGSSFTPANDYIQVAGGEGDDQVSFLSGRQFLSLPTATLAVDLGGGNDYFLQETDHASTFLWLGAGQDRVELGEAFTAHGLRNLVTIADFTSGDSGDVLQLANLLVPWSWNGTENPFLSGDLRLLQQGPDCVVAMGRPGTGDPEELVRLLNVDGAALTGWNFAGFDPRGAPVRGAVLGGTEGGERIGGTAGSDSIQGLGGADLLLGDAGLDYVDGGTGDDTLEGGYGSDLVIGGAGNDRLEDLRGGNDTLEGGDGDDWITVGYGRLNRFDVVTTIRAGSGADTLEFILGSAGLVANLGDDDDTVFLHHTLRSGSELTLGAGRDRVVLLDSYAFFEDSSALVINDFRTGDAGDRLDWMDYVRHRVRSDHASPLTDGWAELQQSGADTLLLFRASGPGQRLVPMVTFRNTDLASFTEFNLGTPLHDPGRGTAGPDLLVGTAGADVLSGLEGADTMMGGDGDDVLRGGSGADSMDGGAGNDTIEDSQGMAVVLGGAGNDTIAVFVTPVPVPGHVDAGDGNDRLVITGDGFGVVPDYAASLGAGDDHVTIGRAITGRILLGEGRDTVHLGGEAWGSGSRLVLTDFAPGAAGDVMDIADYAALHWQAGDPNPFELGHVELRQDGEDVLLWIRWKFLPETPGFELVRFRGARVEAFTAENFAGFDPHVRGNVPVEVVDHLEIGAGQTAASLNTTPIAFAGPRAHYVYDSFSAWFVNHGTVLSELSVGGQLVGMHVEDSGPASFFLNAADGRFVVENPTLWPNDVFEDTWGVYMRRSNMAVQNDGYFRVSAASGMLFGISGGEIVNNGVFIAESGDEAFGVRLGSGGAFYNHGEFIVSGGQVAVGFRADIYLGQPVVNTGTISVTTASGSPNASIAFSLAQHVPAADGAYFYVNTGTITADYAYYVREVGFHYEAFADVLFNSGLISGSVVLANGDDILDNSGLIAGRVLLGPGNDIYEGSLGRHEGAIEGGGGGDTLRGGRSPDRLFGDSGADSIAADGGDDTVDGGSGGDLLDGGGGHDVLSYFDSLSPVLADLGAGRSQAGPDQDLFAGFEELVGSRGADTLLGSVADDVLRGAAGDDDLFGRAGADVLVGGAGSDTLTGGEGDDLFVFDRGGANDEITDFASGDTIDVRGYGRYEGMRQAGTDVLVTFLAGDSLLVRGSLLADVEAGMRFRALASDPDVSLRVSEPLLVDSPRVIDDGMEFHIDDSPPLAGFDHIARSSAAYLERSQTLWNSGVLSISTQATGFITSGVHRGGERAVESDEQLVNSSHGVISVFAAASDAAGITSIDRVWNNGAINVESAAGSAVGIAAAPAGFLVNTGTLSVDAADSAMGLVGERTPWSPSATWNSGLVDVHGGLRSTGFRLDFTVNPFDAREATFTNAGSIQVADETVPLDSVALEISVDGRGWVWNSGSIAADFVIRTAPVFGGFDRPGLNVYNSGNMTGIVYLSAYNDLFVNTGAVSGSVFLGPGNDVYDGRAGTLTGPLDGYDGDDLLLGGNQADTILGGFGRDTISGGGGDDMLNGGSEQDTFRMEIGSGHDTVADFATGGTPDLIEISGYTGLQGMTQSGDDVLLTMSASDTLLIRGTTVAAVTTAMSFSARSIVASIVPPPPASPVAPQAPTFHSWPVAEVQGTSGPDALTGTVGPDSFAASGGDDTMNGGGGYDTAFLAGRQDAYVIVSTDAGVRVSDGRSTDVLTGVEQINFEDGGRIYLFAEGVFDPLQYTASNPDLIHAFGVDAERAARHHFEAGSHEGRSARFNGLAYTASYADLIAAFGVDAAAATRHFISHGHAEGRSSSFDALRYLASYSDLINAFGDDAGAATRHYITNGLREGRHADFNALQYIAAYADLIRAFGTDTDAATLHYVRSGAAEQRGNRFDTLSYMAANPDVLVATNGDVDAAAVHYVRNGFNEGRTVDFDAMRYIASYADLVTAFGTDRAAATSHYVSNGHSEGRHLLFDALRYVASYRDLITAFADDGQAAITHYITNGLAEGRSANFDTLQYALVNSDLVAAFGLDDRALLSHYVRHGAGEDRQAALHSVLGTEGVDSLQGGSGSDVLSGGSGDDILTAGAANDLLLGGRGADTLEGGSGIDVFAYRSTDQGGDTILDFLPGTDKLAFTSSEFGFIPMGALKAPFLAADSASLGNQAGFVYDRSNGSLSVDLDGAGAGVAVQIVTLVGRPELTADDIQIIA